MEAKVKKSFVVRSLALAACSLAWAFPGSAAAQAPAATPAPTPAAKASGFEDAAGIPLRAPVRDVEPVYRAPSPDTLATIRRRGALRVGVVPVEPMVMHDDAGELIGFSVDLARELADDIGVEVEFVETSWSRVVPDLLERHFDVVITGLWVTPVRALAVNFTRPTVVEGTYLIASRALAADFRTREDFDRPGVRIAVYAGTAQEQLALNLFPRATLVRVDGDVHDVIAAVEGKVHAALVQTLAPKRLVELGPDRVFMPFPEALGTAEAAMAIRKGDADFLNYLDSWLSFRRSTGFLEARARHWGEVPAAASPR